MDTDRKKLLLANSKESLVSTIESLEAEINRQQDERDAAYEIAQEIGRRNVAYESENKALKQRVRELEDPDGRHRSGLGWLGKIVQVIRQRGRPLRSQEIVMELMKMNRDGMLSSTDSPDAFLSPVLAKGKKLGRLHLFKVAGTRGGYYAVEEWVDADGKLVPEMKTHLL